MCNDTGCHIFIFLILPLLLRLRGIVYLLEAMTEHTTNGFGYQGGSNHVGAYTHDISQFINQSITNMESRLVCASVRAARAGHNARMMVIQGPSHPLTSTPLYPLAHFFPPCINTCACAVYH